MADSLIEHARDLLAANWYVVLGTVGDDGRPWTSPVYFAAGYSGTEIYWVSALDARHSVNLAARPEVSLVVFDSTVPPYHGRALYAEGTAGVLEGDELERGLVAYPGDPARGASTIDVDSVSGESEYRLFRATTTRTWVLCPRPPREPCLLHGRDEDHRVEVDWSADA